MPTVIITSTTLGGGNLVTTTGTVDGVSTTLSVPFDLLLATGDETAQKLYLANRLVETATAAATTTADVSGLTGTFNV